jgi:Rab-GTPase-TBC domain
MQGSLSTPPGASPHSWLEMHPKQRTTSATSLSFPSKPQGARQLCHPSSAAFRAWDDLHHCQVDLLNHRQSPDFIVPSPVHTVEEEDNIAIYGLHSFAFDYDGEPDLYTTSIGSQLSDCIQFAGFSDILIKHDPYSKPIYSVPLSYPAPYQRSLTSKHNHFHYEMTTTTTAPNSPPDLSGSKSSKSSSFQSSQFDGPDGITNDVSNFEEIGLEEELQPLGAEPVALDRSSFAKRSSSRVSLISAQPLAPPRDLTGGHKRPNYPSLQGQIQYALSNTNSNSSSLSRNGAAAAGLRRGFTAPPTATLPLNTLDDQPRTRSSSPSAKQPASASFATSGDNLRLGPPSRTAGPPSRRGSWQPSRKSVKELEAEYHDSDDELPEDTSLWNVPVSPRPTMARPSSTRSSNRGSPERDVITDGPRPIPLSHAVTAPASPPRHQMSQSLPRNRPPPRTSSLQTATSTASSPTISSSHSFSRENRAKSWTLAMAELSEEARVLTETLEVHADKKGKTHEENIQNGVKSSRPSMESTARRSARSSAIELPPLQKGNILIDPMPLSKEKEAVLTRTRPSWLPPKDPKEEKRHLKEYQRMMAASIDAEKKKEDRIKVRQCEKDDTREALSRIWEQYVCPEWDRVTHEHRTRELWWRGVSPKLRGQIWSRAVGNQLSLNHNSYTKALQRAKDLQGRMVEELSEKERSMRAWFSDIKRDAQCAYPELKLFQKNGPMWQDLVDICCAYVSYRSDVGYLYGVQVSLEGWNLGNPG